MFFVGKFKSKLKLKPKNHPIRKATLSRILKEIDQNQLRMN
jgi:hypothetical protein